MGVASSRWLNQPLWQIAGAVHQTDGLQSVTADAIENKDLIERALDGPEMSEGPANGGFGNVWGGLNPGGVRVYSKIGRALLETGVQHPVRPRPQSRRTGSRNLD